MVLPRHWHVGVIVIAALIFLGGAVFLFKKAGAETVRARCYEQAVQRRRVVADHTTSNAYLDQITEDALKSSAGDATAFLACQQASSLAQGDIQSLAQYEAANHFTK